MFKQKNFRGLKNPYQSTHRFCAHDSKLKILLVKGAYLVAQAVKSLPAMQETGFNPWVISFEDPWEKGSQPMPMFLPEEFHGKRSLAGHSP